MKVISCEYDGYCLYQSWATCLLPVGWKCNQEYRQYERIPLDQMMMEDTNVHDVHDMDRERNR
jgi:hypothetical protein